MTSMPARYLLKSNALHQKLFDVLRTYCSISVTTTPSTRDQLYSMITFRHEDIIIDRVCQTKLRQKPATDNVRFGSTFADHMFQVEWTLKDGWARPKIMPMQDIILHPAAKVLHYATELFEGLKAYRGYDNKIRMFRPELNMQRMLLSARRACLPEFDPVELQKCIEELVRLEQEWVPTSKNSSLYIRPTFIGTDPTLGVSESKQALLYVIVGPVTAFFATGFKPIGLYADTDAVRAWPGGAGQFKLGSNYAPTILTSKKAQQLGCQQVLWLFGDQHYITEVGTMNIFVYWRNKNGEKELVTPPVESGLILPGITRKCLLELAREWNEFKVSERMVKMSEITEALRQNRVLEIFGSGTACIVTPVSRILYKEEGVLNDYYVPTTECSPSLLKRFEETITGIQYGRISKPNWTTVVDAE